VNRPASLRRGWWRRRVIAVIVTQLRHGVTPRKVALAVSIGGVLALFPVLGASTLLCLGVGALLRLNQPIMLLMNALGAPLQLMLLVPCYRAAEWIGAPHLSLSIAQLWDRFNEIGLVPFMSQFGAIALGGVGVWSIAAAPTAVGIYLIVSPPIRLLAGRLSIAA
jgi:uncharacterized protein (DUF2062 family)